MKVTFELKVYTDETKSELLSVIAEHKNYPQADGWTEQEVENFLQEEYEVWLCTRTDGGWKQ